MHLDLAVLTDESPWPGVKVVAVAHPSWVLIHASEPEVRTHSLIAKADNDALAVRATKRGTHKDIGDRLKVIARMDAPTMKAKIMTAAGFKLNSKGEWV